MKLLPLGAHGETVLPNVTRRRISVRYERERVELPDGDFLDLDFGVGKKGCRAGGDTAILALHGLEGDSRAPYIKSFARAALGRGFAFVAMNMRGCSGDPNRLPRFYHSGETEDLRRVLAYLGDRYERVCLLGFSLGGNVVLKALGERGQPNVVCAALAFSVPVDLAGSARKIGQQGNGFYMRRFIRLLARKIEEKAGLFPEAIDSRGCRELASFVEFDERYTAPLHGFASAEDYWARCSSLTNLGEIQTPTLLINARNDPFLSADCFPEEIARAHCNLHACFPDRGGHVGFPSIRRNGEAWHERMSLDFLSKLLPVSSEGGRLESEI